MKITYYGVRGSCPCSSDEHRRYGGNTSCVLVEAVGEPPLILDMGTGMRALGVDLAGRCAEPGAPLGANVLLSHLHYDHVLGLPFFGPMHDVGSTLDIYGPAQDGSSLHDVLASAVQPPFFPVGIVDFKGSVRFHDLSDPVDFQLGGLCVTVRSVPHFERTLGYRIEFEGEVLTYLSDHQAPADGDTVDDNVVELCRDADLVIHDAQYTEEAFRNRPDWGHSTASYAVKVAQAAGARRVDLFHYDPSLTDDVIDELLSAAGDLAAGGEHPVEVRAAAEGTCVTLGVVERVGRSRV